METPRQTEHLIIMMTIMIIMMKMIMMLVIIMIIKMMMMIVMTELHRGKVQHECRQTELLATVNRL